MSTYLTYRQFLNQRYGGPARRVPVDLGFGCPHRDNSTGKGGCVFCGEDAGRAVHVWKDMDLKKQLQAGIMQVEQDYPDWDIMAYFQAFTSTYAEVDVLRERVKEVTECADFRSLIFGTRPDCLPPDIIAYLNELAEKYDVWVELGVQTANETTLKRINRGHNFACVRDAVQRLHKSGINVACHVILGLPGEGINDFRRTAEAIAALPFIGVKIHHLQVVKESRLACLWEQGDVKTYNEFEYTDVLIDFLRRIPPHWPVMRLMSEAIPTSLLAPRWRMTKAEFLNYLTKEMTRRKVSQGDKIKKIYLR